MSEERKPEGHKRSKSALALSLLHRDKTKNGDNDDDASTVPDSDVPSPAESPTTASSTHHSFSHLRSNRHKSKTSGVTAQGGGNIETMNSSAITMNRDVVPKAQDVGPTIEQSVRMFKLFEILRSGDSAAIARAVQETSELHTIEEGSPTSPTSSGGLEGTTILHLAIQCADPSVVEEILAVARNTPGATVDINARDRDGNTPIHIASMLGRPSTVRLLLAQPGINDSLVNYHGRSPLDLARTPEIFQQLQLSRSLFVDAKTKEIQALVVRKSYNELERLLEDSKIEMVIDVNSGELAVDPSTVQSGGTLLHEAARNKDIKLIQILLLHGADPFRRDRRGKLPQDITKDDRTRNILKKSPAAAAAQRVIQEKAVLGNTTAPTIDNQPGGKDGREMKGYLKKWTNYTTGYKLRWFVLEDGVLSYYKHQDDAGSACRGAINMRIAKLFMDPQDKTRFEIQGKSSVKYHLKANHIVEAKRWFWALNNAIQWSKDEAKEEQKQKQRSADVLRQAKTGVRDSDSDDYKLGGKGLAPSISIGAPLSSTPSRASMQESIYGATNAAGDDEGSAFGSFERLDVPSEMARSTRSSKFPEIPADPDDEEEYGDEASSHEMKPASKDAFNITAHSASLQLSLLGHVSSALKAECLKETALPINDPSITQAILTYESAVRSLQDLVADLLKISRDRDAYWQHRLDREADVRRLWEDSMARVAKEQEELEGRIGESEIKRKRTKKALREALESTSVAQSRPDSRGVSQEHIQISEVVAKLSIGNEGTAPGRRKSVGFRDIGRRKSTIADLTNISDSDEDEDEEFFDAVGTGEVEVVDEMPVSASSPPPVGPEFGQQGSILDAREAKRTEITPSFKGYEDPIRKRLKMDADERPKISLWGILKSMIGKDMTKMTLPVSFNEPTSLLQRVAEDMEYTDLLDTAADRTDSTERMVYVAAFAASEYASTIGRVAKPFNPLLGETYEYVRPDKGYRFFIEQVSHHPPIGAAWAESPKWDYFGESAVKSKFYGKSFDINPLGTWFLKLRPASGGEELYTWKKVTSSVIGIITGSPTVDNYGTMEIKNWSTGEVCTLEFKPRGWKASSAYQVTGKVIGADRKTRWSIGGRWNDKIYARLTPGFEEAFLAPPGQTTSSEPNSTQAFLVWEAHPRPSGIPFNLTPFVVTFQHLPDNLRPLLPPTDTRLRPDQRAMEDGEYELAATEKNRVEEKQRATRRIREAKGEEFTPRWFSKGKCEVTGEEYWVSTGQYWKTREAVANGGKWEGVEEIY